jgi:glutamate dehydrogenase (NADP+)
VLNSLEDFLIQNSKYIDSGVLEMLLEPERILQFRVPWVNEEGKVVVNTGYRVQFNSALDLIKEV